MEEHPSDMREVVGSIPTRSTIRDSSGVEQAIEARRVVGSIPTLGTSIRSPEAKTPVSHTGDRRFESYRMYQAP